jgi:hypothetical protein
MMRHMFLRVGTLCDWALHQLALTWFDLQLDGRMVAQLIKRDPANDAVSWSA